MANQYSADIPKGFNVPKQVRLDSITGIQNEETLKNLGENNNLAFKYYEGLKIYCKDEKTTYVWREIVGIETGLLDSHFIYPTYDPVDGIDYSGKSFNFFLITFSNNPLPDGSETKIEAGSNTTVIGSGTILNPYIISSTSESSEIFLEEGDNITITGTGASLDPYIINADAEDIGLVKTVLNEIIAPTQTLSIINSELTGKALTTKEYVESVIPLPADGSETKVIAGTNITVTGNGTTLTPYYISTNNDDISQYTDTMAINAVGTALNNSETILFDYDSVEESITANININAVSQSTGLLYGGKLLIGSLNTLFTLESGEGYIYDSLNNTNTRVSWLTQEDLTPIYLTSSPATYILIDVNGTIVQQTISPTSSQIRDYIYIGKLAHTTLTTVLFAITEPIRIFDISSQIQDLNMAIGPINIGKGNIFSPNGSNLNINISAGNTYRPGANYIGDRKSPSITTELAVVAPVFRRKYRTGTGGWVTVNSSLIDPDYYDNNSGTLITVPVGKYTVQQLWRFGGSGTAHVDYGQAFYDTMELAKASIGKTIVVEDVDNVRDAIKRGWLIVRQGANNLSNISLADFIPADKFGERSNSGNISTLQQSYNNSFQPEIITNSTLGALTLKRGSLLDTDNVFEIQNASTITTARITGEGKLYATSYNDYIPVTDLRNINTTSPLLGGGNLTADRTLSIQQSSTTQDGYLSSTDWNIFNSKQANIGYTPENVANKATDFTTVNNTLYPSVQATKTYVDFIQSNESLAGAKRKGDVLYGILDQYTGEEMTLQLVTGTPTVDGIIYFQLGAEYFKREFTDIYASWFNDPTLIDFQIVQKAINATILEETTLILENKTYLLAAGMTIDTRNMSSYPVLKIAGSGSTILKAEFNNGTLFNCLGNIEGVLNAGYVNLTIENIDFWNAGTGNTAINLDAIKTIDFNNLFIRSGFENGIVLKSVYASPRVRNSRIASCTNAGIMSLGQVNNIEYFNTAFLSCNYGFYASPNSGTGLLTGELDTNSFNKCDFEGNTKSIYIDSPFGCASLNIYNNHFEGNSGNEIEINNKTTGLTSINIGGINIYGNIFMGINGILIGNDNTGGNVENVLFYGNRATATTVLVDAIKIATECPDKSFNNLIFNNHYLDSNGDSTLLEKIVSSKLTVRNNVNGTASVMPLYKVSPEIPATTATTSGIQGDLRYDDDYLYLKNANGWGRGVLNDFPSTVFNPKNNVVIEQNDNINSALYLNPYKSALGTSYQWLLSANNSTKSYSFEIGELGASYFEISNSASGVGGIVKVGTTPTTSAGTYDFLTRNTTTGVVEKVTSASIATTASPTFTGTPAAPTAAPGTNTTQIATMAAVQTAKSSILSEDNTYTGSQTFNNTVTFDNIALLNAYTVATLPTGGITGAIAYVTDATAPTYLGTLTGGGSVVCPVFYNGTAWVSH